MANGFVFTTSLRVEWPVKVRVPLDGGRYSEQQFIAVFDVQKISDVKKLDYETFDIGLLGAALVGASGMKDAAGQDVPFDEEVKEVLIEMPHTRMGLVNAYNEATQGRRGKS